MERGYVKLWRRSIDSVVFEDPELWKLWSLCLMLATHKGRTVLIGETKDAVKMIPGQFLTGRYALHSLYYPGKKKKGEKRKSPLTLWRWLQKLKNMEKLNIKSYSKASVITILNWEDYQVGEQEVNNSRTSVEHELNTNKNEKNEENEKKTTKKGKIDLTKMEMSDVDFEKIPSVITKESIEQFILHRKVLKAPLTQNALELTCGSVMKCHEAYNMDPNDALQHCIKMGWRSINVKWLERDFGKNGSSNPGQKKGEGNKHGDFDKRDYSEDTTSTENIPEYLK